MSDGLKITAGERLLLWRKRKRWTQLRAAKHYGVGADIFRAWETGERAEDVPKVSDLGRISEVEKYILFRTRAGLTQKQLADRIKCSRVWVVMMETGRVPLDRARNYWGA